VYSDKKTWQHALSIIADSKFTFMHTIMANMPKFKTLDTKNNTLAIGLLEDEDMDDR
jgi:hypothetical protein